MNVRRLDSMTAAFAAEKSRLPVAATGDWYAAVEASLTELHADDMAGHAPYGTPAYRDWPDLWYVWLDEHRRADGRCYPDAAAKAVAVAAATEARLPGALHGLHELRRRAPDLLGDLWLPEPVGPPPSCRCKHCRAVAAE